MRFLVTLCAGMLLVLQMLVAQAEAPDMLSDAGAPLGLEARG